MAINNRALLNNRYQIVETLTRGGFGETFLAIDTYLPSQKKCVIKQLKPIINEAAIPRWMYDRFKQEARILESLGAKHKQIPQLYAYFQEEQNFFLVQEWIEGITLTEKVKQEGVLSGQQVENILKQLLPVLSYIHGQNIVHRDLKPDNIIYRYQDQCPVLIDFGAVKEAITEKEETIKSAYSIAIGTPGYMASEQAAGRPIYSSDLYSLGLTAIYLLTGKNPQQLKTNLKTGEIMWRKELPSLHSYLASLIDRAIRFNPRERFATADEMLLALAAGNSAILNENEKYDKSSSFSQMRTKEVIGKSWSSLKSHATTTGKTLNIINTSREEAVEKEPRFHIPLFLPLILLPLMAITSFLFGYQLWKQGDNSNIPEIVKEQPLEDPSDEQINTSKQDEPQVNAEEPEDNFLSQKPKQEQNSSNSIPFSLEDNNDFNIPDELEEEIQTLPPIGLSAQELSRRWGKPSYEDLAYDNKVTLVAYDNPFPRIEQVKYLVSNETKEVVQIDFVVSSQTRMRLISRIMNRAFHDQINDEIKYAIAEVLTGKTDLRSFYFGNYQGMVQKRNQRIEIRVWDRDFSL